MKNSFFALIALLMLLSGKAMAQDADNTEHKKKHEVTISNHGISIHAIDSAVKAAEKNAPPKRDKKWTNNMSLDLGTNFIKDNSNYSSAAVKNYLAVPAAQQNAALFNLKQVSSINVNFYPLMESYRTLKTPGQKIYITTGLGFQFYNFRYENNITYTRSPSTVINDSLKFSKNKLGIDYMNVPLMLTFKTRIARNEAKPKDDTWLVYGFGITEGLNVSTWSKQISGELGKVKVHNGFNTAGFNTCITAEIGVDDIIRFYGSYQVTSLYNSATGLDVHPFSVGIRISGI